MHHAQAVEMTALIASHTENKELGEWARGSAVRNQDEIKFMKRWLAHARRRRMSMAMAGMPGMDKSAEPCR